MHVRHLRQECAIGLMRNPQVDADLLDELARRQLPLAGEREVMVLR